MKLKHAHSALFPALAIAATLLPGASATASTNLYLETGFGVGMMMKSQELYPTAPARTGYGFGSNITFANAFGTGHSSIQIHLGIQQRLTQASGNGRSYALATLHPAVRIEMQRFLIGFGATPLVWKKDGTTTDLLTGYQSVSGAVAAFGEAALLWRVVPHFHLSIGGSAEFVSRSGSRSPAPALQATFNMRFFLGSGAQAGTGSRRKYDGWRYPFGVSLF
jgi:hypothetical protein